jgi:hypothetical protein
MAIVNRNLAYRSWKLERTAELRAIYKRFRNSVNALVRQTKRRYINRILNSSLPSKILWRNLDTIGIYDANDSVNDLCPNRLILCW